MTRDEIWFANAALSHLSSPFQLSVLFYAYEIQMKSYRKFPAYCGLPPSPPNVERRAYLIVCLVSISRAAESSDEIN